MGALGRATATSFFPHKEARQYREGQEAVLKMVQNGQYYLDLQFIRTDAGGDKTEF